MRYWTRVDLFLLLIILFAGFIGGLIGGVFSYWVFRTWVSAVLP